MTWNLLIPKVAFFSVFISYLNCNMKNYRLRKEFFIIDFLMQSDRKNWLLLKMSEFIWTTYWLKKKEMQNIYMWRSNAYSISPWPCAPIVLHLIGCLWVSLFIEQSEFFKFVTSFLLYSVWTDNYCICFSQFEWRGLFVTVSLKD